MINAIFIISSAGTCVFYYEYKKLGGGLDQDLVSGFLIALQNFVGETFGFKQTPQKLDLAAGVRLVYSINENAGLLGSAVADSIDHPKLVQKLIDKILNKFIELFEDKLDKLYDTSQFSDFVDFVDQTIKSKITKCGVVSCLLGIVLASLIIPGVLIPSIFLFNQIKFDITQNIFALTSFLFLIGGLPQILSGYIAGNKKLAVISSLILSLAIIPVVILIWVLWTLMGMQIGIITYVIFLPLILPENIALAYFGGYR